MGIKTRDVIEIFEDGKKIDKLVRELQEDKERLENSKPNDDKESLKTAIRIKKQKIEKLIQKFTQLDLILLIMANFEAHNRLKTPRIYK